MQGQGQRTGKRAQAHGQSGNRGPDQFGHGAQHVEHHIPWRTPARQGQQQARDRGQQGADYGDGQGLPDALQHLEQPGLAQVGREKATHEVAHAGGGIRREQRREINIQKPQTGP